MMQKKKGVSSNDGNQEKKTVINSYKMPLIYNLSTFLHSLVCHHHNIKQITFE